MNDSETNPPRLRPHGAEIPPELPHPLDPERWTALHHEPLLRFALSRVGDYALAEDLVQDTYVSAWKGRKSFRGDCSERTWLTGILRNKIVDHYRRARTRLSILAGDLDGEGREPAEGSWLERQPDRRSSARPEAEVERRDFLGDLHEALGALPPKMRSAFAMRELQGLSTSEITEAMRISKENLWVLIHRARQALGEQLAGRWERLDAFGGIPRA
jgi:RNA polymerase sigma-70 factor (TIGR02943 family)